MNRFRKMFKKSSSSARKDKRRHSLRRSASMPLYSFDGIIVSSDNCRSQCSASQSNQTHSSGYTGNEWWQPSDYEIYVDIARENLKSQFSEEELSDDERRGPRFSWDTELLDQFPEPPQLNAYSHNGLSRTNSQRIHYANTTPFVHRKLAKKRTLSNSSAASYVSYSRPTQLAYPGIRASPSSTSVSNKHERPAHPRGPSDMTTAHPNLSIQSLDPNMMLKGGPVARKPTAQKSNSAGCYQKSDLVDKRVLSATKGMSMAEFQKRGFASNAAASSAKRNDYYDREYYDHGCAHACITRGTPVPH